MIKPTETLMVARLIYPEYDWRLYKGRVSRIATNAFDEIEIPFDLKDPGDEQAACIALTHRGWTITKFTQSGQQHWRATKSVQTGEMSGMGGGPKHPDLKRLIVQLVEMEQKR